MLTNFIAPFWSTHGVMVITVANKLDNPSSILGWCSLLQYSANTLGKDMNQHILPPAMDELKGRLGSLTLVWQSASEKENRLYSTWKLTLCLILLAVGGLGKYNLFCYLA